jgi:TcpE family
MNRRSAYSYRKLWRYPIKVYSLGKGEKGLVFSKGIEIRQIIVALLILGSMLLFRDSIDTFLPGSIKLAFYLVTPWVLSGLICSARLDGKRLDRFFIGYFHYLSDRKNRYSSGRRVLGQQEKNQRYEPF